MQRKPPRSTILLTRRRAYTLVELLVVIGVILLLSVMTIGAINLSVTQERVRSGARQIQSLIEGSRDRAIYAQEPRGIRLLVNEEITETIGGGPTPFPTLCTTLVYIGSAGQDTSEEDRDDLDGDGIVDELRKYVQLPDTNDPDFIGPPPVPPDSPLRRAIVGTNTNWRDLYSRGLLGPGSTIRIGGCDYRIDPRSFPVATEAQTHNPTPGPGESYGGFGGTSVSGINSNGDNPFPTPPGPPMPTNDEVLYLLWTDSCLAAPSALPPPGRAWDTVHLTYSIQLEPDVLPGEEASVLPRSVCIDLQSSHLPESWVTDLVGGGKQFSNQMDLIFAPGGGVVGDAGSAGIIHLHVSHIGDAIANTLPGSPTKTDGTPREGDEFGITIYTRSGRVIVHPMDQTATAYPPPWTGTHSVGDIVAPRLYNGLIYEMVADSGGGSGSEPDWNLAPGGITIDAGQQWRGQKHDVWNFGEEGEVAR